MRDGDNANERVRKRENEKESTIQLCYAKIVFFDLTERKRKDTKREMWGASEWSHSGQLRQSHSTNMTCI